jgi:hypothetical protein
MGRLILSRVKGLAKNTVFAGHYFVLIAQSWLKLAGLYAI